MTVTAPEEKKKARSRSSCCCCCRRQPSEPRDSNGNGTRLAKYNETLPVLGVGEDKTPTDSIVFQPDTNKDPPEDKYTAEKCRKTCLKCCKKFFTFLFSNIGLCSAVVAYSILGGCIFRKLEAPNEIQKRHFVASRRAQYAFDIWNLTQTMLYLHEPNFTAYTETLLIGFQNEILEAKKTGWDGSDGDVEPQWSFAGSLLYSVTVITTIGYGHIAPKTFEGRLVTIFYAIIGIPLTLLCLANMGSVLGNSFRFLYMQLCRLLSCMCCPERESFSKQRARNSMAKSKSLSMTSKVELAQSQSQELDPLKIKIEEGNVGDSNTLKVIPLNSKKNTIRSSKSMSRSTSGTGSDINIVVEDYDQPKVKPPSTKVEDIRVPVFVSLMIIAIYIFGGALMFSMWEGWDYLEGSYFCFITLSTIGFGDYVPGSISGKETEGSREKLIICCVYLMFGLAVIAMCFNLMQEDVRAKFIWLGQKVGLIDKKR